MVVLLLQLLLDLIYYYRLLSTIIDCIEKEEELKKT